MLKYIIMLILCINCYGASGEETPTAGAVVIKTTSIQSTMVPPEAVNGLAAIGGAGEASHDLGDSSKKLNVERSASKMHHCKELDDIYSKAALRDLESSTGILLDWVKKEDHLAEAYVSLLYLRGLGGVKSNLELAVAYAKKSLDWLVEEGKSNNPYAQNLLARFYEEGLGVTADESKSLKWHILSAEGGHHYSQAVLGEKYARGQGVVQSEEKSLMWFNRAAAQGDSYAQRVLGFYSGSGSKPDDGSVVLPSKKIEVGVTEEELKRLHKSYVDEYMQEFELEVVKKLADRERRNFQEKGIAHINKVMGINGHLNAGRRTMIERARRDMEESLALKRGELLHEAYGKALKYASDRAALELENRALHLGRK